MSAERTTETRRPHPSSVYRIYDEHATLIYVGVTDRGHKRQSEHVQTKPWAWEIAETHWEHFRTRKAALNRERELIATKHPRHNVLLRDGADGQPEQIEFKLRADQYELLKRCYAEGERLGREWEKLQKDYKARLSTHRSITHRLLRSVRAGRPLTEKDNQVIDAYLAHLELLDQHEAEREKKWAA